MRPSLGQAAGQREWPLLKTSLLTLLGYMFFSGAFGKFVDENQGRSIGDVHDKSAPTGVPELRQGLLLDLTLSGCDYITSNVQGQSVITYLYCDELQRAW